MGAGHRVDIWIATTPDVPASLPCILSQDIFKDLQMIHDPTDDILAFQVAEQTALSNCLAGDRPGISRDRN